MPEYWIAPALQSGAAFLEPLQGAHLKTMGVSSRGRRRAPTAWSCGSTPTAQPRYSLHSRVDGINHGISPRSKSTARSTCSPRGRAALLRLPLDRRSTEDLRA